MNGKWMYLIELNEYEFNSAVRFTVSLSLSSVCNNQPRDIQI